MKPGPDISYKWTRASEVAPWFYWLLLCATAAVGGVFGGAPLPQAAIAAVFAASPAFVAFGVSFWRDRARACEIETVYGVLFASLATALSGGARSSLAVLFALPILAALANGRGRLALEAAVFGALGYMTAAFAVRYDVAPTMPGLNALAAPLTICGLVLAALFAARAAQRQSAPKADAPEPERGEIDTQRARAADAEALRDVALSRAAELETRLAKAEQAAKASESALAERMRFFAQTNHELRTPLNAIIGFADVLRNGLFGPLSDKYRDYAGLIHEGGRNLQVVVDDVLDLSKIEAGRYEIMRETISLNDAASDAARFMGDQAARRGVRLETDLVEDVEAFADARAMRQIALNLISNGLKFTGEGGVVQIWARQDENGAARMGVRDTGRGISKEDLAKLTAPFEQVGAREGQGAGLGLSVVRAFAELHGGAVKIKSAPGEGSDIFVVLPAKSEV